MITLLLIVGLSYLIGSFPTAILVGRLLLKDDIRKYGSGNAGATNVYRVMGLVPAVIVLLIDMGKGYIATGVISRIGIEALPVSLFTVRLLAGTAAIVGHIWTVFAGFRGGKGVGTAFGVLVGLAPIPSLICLGIWLIVVLTTRIVSIGSILAGLAFSVILWIEKTLFHRPIPAGLLVLGTLLTFLIVWTHRSNIRRLIRGEEHRFGTRHDR